jgi:hypothetical protein
MKSNLNKHRVNNLLRGIQTSINLFESQGHTDVYFTAQFYRNGKKQNGIERGDLQSFGKQIRTYITSEEADSARVEFFSESTGKSVYSKVLSDLRVREPEATNAAANVVIAQNGLSGYAGLGEAQIAEMIDRKVAEERRNDEFQRLSKEVDELRKKNEEISNQNEELEARIKAKSDIEFYTSLISSALPGLAPLFTGTPLAQAASLLTGIGGNNESEKVQLGGADGNEESSSIASLVAEFCVTLNQQELAAVHLLFMSFEKDRSKIQSALHYVTSVPPAQTVTRQSATAQTPSAQIPQPQAKAA